MPLKHKHVWRPMKYHAQDLNRPHYVRLCSSIKSIRVCVLFIPILLDEGCTIAHPGSPGGLGVLACQNSPPSPQKSHHEGNRFGYAFLQYLHRNGSCNLTVGISSFHKDATFRPN